MTAPLSHRERALEAAESWEDHLDYPLEGVWRPEDTTNLADLVTAATLPAELLAIVSTLGGIARHYREGLSDSEALGLFLDLAEREEISAALDLYEETP